MKRVITIGLFVNVVLLAVEVELLWKERTEVAHAAGGGGVPLGNGDVNGDGKFNIADAIYIINNQFMGGPAPVAIECPPPVVKGLPVTGQKMCYEG